MYYRCVSTMPSRSPTSLRPQGVNIRGLPTASAELDTDTISKLRIAVDVPR